MWTKEASISYGRGNLKNLYLTILVYGSRSAKTKPVLNVVYNLDGIYKVTGVKVCLTAYIPDSHAV